MQDNCDACSFLQKPDLNTQILETTHWSVGVGNNQAYFGRAYCTLRAHKGSLGELSEDEWHDFHVVVRRLEQAYKAVYGAEPLNWGCYMNHAFRKEPYNPHVHWHIYPRYKVPPALGDIRYEDPLFGNFYDEKAERFVDDSVVEQIASALRNFLSNR